MRLEGSGCTTLSVVTSLKKERVCVCTPPIACTWSLLYRHVDQYTRMLTCTLHCTATCSHATCVTHLLYNSLNTYCDWTHTELHSPLSLFSLFCLMTVHSLLLVTPPTPVTCAAHVEDMVEIIFQYIAMLRREGPKEWIFKECSVSTSVQCVSITTSAFDYVSVPCEACTSCQLKAVWFGSER